MASIQNPEVWKGGVRGAVMIHQVLAVQTKAGAKAMFDFRAPPTRRA